MKKIGITTFYNAINYGAFLQCFALQELLNDKYDAFIIDHKNEKISGHYNLIKTKNIKSIIRSIIFFKKNYLKRKNFNKCIKKYLKFGSIDDKYDSVIAGSDQIWNIKLTGGIDQVFTLKEFKETKKISYASSIGQEELIQENKDIYKGIVDEIDYVSVREESAQKELNKISAKKIKVNIDPTLTLTKEVWDKYTTKNKIKDDYIFSYFVGATNENYNVLNSFSEKMGMKVISYSENPKEKNIIKKCYEDNPFEFITKIKNAKYVFTSSFHGTVFSIIFNKEFICMLPKTKANRIIDLLEKLGLQNRAIKTIDDLNKIDLNKKIDYKKVNKKLDELRKDSIDWLIDKIEK